MEERFRKEMVEGMIKQQHVPMGLVLEPSELNALIDDIPTLKASLENCERFICDLNYDKIPYASGQPIGVETQCMMFFTPRQEIQQPMTGKLD